MLIRAVADAQAAGFPTDVEDKEAYFMNEVAQGEALCQEGMNPHPQRGFYIRERGRGGS